MSAPRFDPLAELVDAAVYSALADALPQIVATIEQLLARGVPPGSIAVIYCRAGASTELQRQIIACARHCWRRSRAS